MNKIIVSIVFAIILVLGINKVTDVIFYVEKPEKSAYQVATVTTVASTTSAETGLVSSESGNIMALFASPSITEGGSNKIGPALWGVLGRPAGSIPDYKYSKAMAAHGKNWSFEEMNGFLIKPKDWIKGTKMSFAGLKKAKERAAVILYMNENTNSPLPLQ